jgi:hypothetical protein
MRNEYILELADQIAYNIPGPHSISDEFILAYTEFIIRECMKLGDKALQDGKWPGDIIKDHFGME